MCVSDTASPLLLHRNVIAWCQRKEVKSRDWQGKREGYGQPNNEYNIDIEETERNSLNFKLKVEGRNEASTQPKFEKAV